MLFRSVFWLKTESLDGGDGVYEDVAMGGECPFGTTGRTAGVIQIADCISGCDKTRAFPHKRTMFFPGSSRSAVHANHRACHRKARRQLGMGVTEQIVGRWFAQGGGRREKTIIATKVYGKMAEWPNGSRLSAAHIKRACEESLRRMGIAYRIYGGISFYQRKEIKDFLAYLRIVVNPNDEEALKRIINYPVRGIGKTTIDKAVLYANTNQCTLWDVLCNASFYKFRGNALESIDGFVTMVKMFQSELKRKNAYELAMIVGKSTLIVKELFNDKSTEGLARYENVQELLNSKIGRAHV